MKKFIMIVLILSFSKAFGSSYGIFTAQNYGNNFNPEDGERILFIIDLSNSMNEPLENSTKFRLMQESMAKIIYKINPQAWVGLRVYGHRMGITPIEACRASSLVVPISQNNAKNIEYELMRRRPRGMTPITYSLKQSLKNDFIGFNGKKHIILMTDGGENCDESPCKYVMNLIKIRRDVQIDVIAFNISDIDDLEQLKCTALVTSGKFYEAETSAQLFNGFNNSISGVKNVEAQIVVPK